MQSTEPLTPILSDRELEILQLVATGATNQQIALQLVISPNTVKVHLRNIFGKLGVESRTEATMYAVRQGWIAAPAAVEEMPAEEEPLLPHERLSAWQRALFVVTALAVVLLVFLPPRRTASTGAGGPFTDRVGGIAGSLPGAASSRWVSKAQMPTERARLAVVAYEGKVYAIGGDTVEGVSGAVEVYDPATDTWTRGANKPHPVRNVGAAVAGDWIYVPGGFDALDQAITTVEAYAPEVDAWTEVAPLPRPVFAYAIVAVQGRLCVFGGWDGTRYLDSVLIYDPGTDTWSAGTPMPQARGFCAAAAVGEQVYVIGGYDGQGESSSCELYELSKEGTDESPWSERAPLQAGRGGLAAVAADGYVYAIGGGWTSPLAFNERYDVAADSWTAFDSPVLGQWRTLGAAPVRSEDGTTIYVIGGWSERYLSTNYAYKTFFRVYLPGP